jgi:hypothetical protein
MSSFPRRMSVYSLLTLLVLPFALGSAPGAHAQVWEGGQQLFSSHLDDSRVGQVLAVGDFNGDGYQDLLAGTPLADARNAANVPQADAGSTSLYLGGPDGLGNPSVFFVDPLPGDRNGAAVAAGDFDNDGRDEIAVG